MAVLLAALALAGCDSANRRASFASDQVQSAFHDHGIALRRASLPFPSNGQVVLSPVLDGSFAPYQVWILRSPDEAKRYEELVESASYRGAVTDSPEYAVEQTVVNGNVLLVVFRGSRDGEDASAIIDGLD